MQDSIDSFMKSQITLVMDALKVSKVGWETILAYLQLAVLSLFILLANTLAPPASLFLTGC